MRSAAEAERAVGIELYASDGEPCNAVAKSQAGDFVVEEEISVGGLVTGERPGYFPLYRVQKHDIDTMHMAEELSRLLKSRVSYGGMKDKKAQAVQYATPASLRAARPTRVERERFTATLVGYVPKPLSRGAVVGNTFEINLRNCCSEIEGLVEETMRLARARKIPNFYGLQRFGTSGAGTHRIGKALVRGEFQDAVNLMLLEPRKSDGESSRAARELMSEGDYKGGARLLPQGRDIERKVATELSRRPNDWIGALRAVPLRLRRLYVQAYQSMIFNKTLSAALAHGEDVSVMRPGDNWAEESEDGLVTSRVMGTKDKPTARAVPMVQIVGYAFRDYGSRFDAYVKKALEEEGVSPGRFFVDRMQEVSSEGGFRRPHLAVLNASWRTDGDVAHLRFTLGRGQYATILLREVIKPSDPAAVGLA